MLPLPCPPCSPTPGFLTLFPFPFFLHPALQNVEFLQGYGSFLAECGPREEAVAVLQRAVQQEPDEGFEKYM